MIKTVGRNDVNTAFWEKFIGISYNVGSLHQIKRLNAVGNVCNVYFTVQRKNAAFDGCNPVI